MFSMEAKANTRQLPAAGHPERIQDFRLVVMTYPHFSHAYCLPSTSGR
jgi:hypothetical protein